jgi:hypothetical protein
MVATLALIVALIAAVICGISIAEFDKKKKIYDELVKRRLDESGDNYTYRPERSVNRYQQSKAPNWYREGRKEYQGPKRQKRVERLQLTEDPLRQASW